MQGGGQKRDEVPDDHGVSACKVPISYRYHARAFFYDPAVMGALRVMWGGGGLGGVHDSAITLLRTSPWHGYGP